MADLSLYSVKGVLILDNDGNRIFTKYYEPPHSTAAAASITTTHEHNDLAQLSLKEQKQFEKGLFSKTNKQSADVIIYEGKLVVYKQLVDLAIYIIGDLEENECMLYQVVMGLKDCFEILLRHSVDKRTLMENFDMIALAIDETIDSGIILEVDPVIISSRVSKAPANDQPNLQNIDLSEQGLMNMYQFARGRLADKLRQQFQ